MPGHTAMRPISRYPSITETRGGKVGLAHPGQLEITSVFHVNPARQCRPGLSEVVPYCILLQPDAPIGHASFMQLSSVGTTQV